MKILFAVMALLTSLLSSAVFAGFPLENGQISIDVSGSGGSYGRDGEYAGDINLSLSYTDATKKAVKLEGNTIIDKVMTPFSEIVPLTDLNQINVYANGGDGGSGYDGTNGRDGISGSNGRDGWSGSDGCPPGDGSSGENGGNGTNGTDGTDGTDGGNGGNGGKIHVSAPASQSELLLLVNASVTGGRYGAGGSGGRGGRGGSGGSGGRGGEGGRNTCSDNDNHDRDHGGDGDRDHGGDGDRDHGRDGDRDHDHDRDGDRDGNRMAFGPEGRDGSNGMNGSSGSDGRDGRDGYSGSSGRNGTLTFSTTTETGSIDYPAPFDLAISDIKSIDDNEDGILEPGEPLHVTQFKITNNSSMPTPAGQVINLLLKNSPTLTLKKAPSLSINEIIPANGSKVFNFSKGSLVFLTIDDENSVGLATSINANVAINSINYDLALDPSQTIEWPIVVKNNTDKLSGYFGDSLTMKYSFQNVGTKDIGPNGEQPIEVEFSWESDKIPGSDVTATLANGQSFTLNQPYIISNLDVLAGNTLNVPVKINVKNSKSLIVNDGTLKMTVRLKDFVSGGEDAIATYSNPIHLVMDVRPMAFDKTLDLKSSKIKCYFPNATMIKNIDVQKVEVSKLANSDVVYFKVFHKVLLAMKNSPSISGAAYDFAPYMGLFKQDSLKNDAILGLLNSVIAPASKNVSEKNWVISPGSCELKGK